MRVIPYDSGGTTYYKCGTCGNDFDESVDNITLHHPKEADHGNFLSDMRPIDCPDIGRQCRIPFIEVEELNTRIEREEAIGDDKLDLERSE